eukprot:XP_011432965.1 PREDICTED: perlucin-like protein [Crassostrea gigas]
MASCILIVMAVIVLDGSFAQNEEKTLKKELSDLHYKLFKTLRNQTNMIKMAVFETQCNVNGCTFNGCGGRENNTCENEVFKKLNQIQSSVDSLKNSVTSIKGCKQGWKSFKGHCYLLIKIPVNWFEGQMKCREYGATLVQIDTAQENNWILKNFPKVRFWLDHTDVGKEGRWKMFSTGKSPTFSFWSPGQPDNHRGSQNCGYSYFNKNTGAWDDGGCSARFWIICEISG